MIHSVIHSVIHSDTRSERRGRERAWMWKGEIWKCEREMIKRLGRGEGGEKEWERDRRGCARTAGHLWLRRVKTIRSAQFRARPGISAVKVGSQLGRLGGSWAPHWAETALWPTPAAGLGWWCSPACLLLSGEPLGFNPHHSHRQIFRRSICSVFPARV